MTLPRQCVEQTYNRHGMGTIAKLTIIAATLISTPYAMCMYNNNTDYTTHVAQSFTDIPPHIWTQLDIYAKADVFSKAIRCNNIWLISDLVENKNYAPSMSIVIPFVRNNATSNEIRTYFMEFYITHFAQLSESPHNVWNVLTPEEKDLYIRIAATVNHALLDITSSIITPDDIAHMSLASHEIENTALIQRTINANNIPSALYLLETFGEDIDLSNNYHIHWYRDRYNNPLIYHAIAHEYIDTVNMLLEENTPVIDGNGNNTMLHHAVYRRNPQLVYSILHVHPRGIYDQDHNGETPLEIMLAPTPEEEDVNPHMPREQFSTDTASGNYIDETNTGEIISLARQVMSNNEELEQTDNEIRLEMLHAAIRNDDAQAMEQLIENTDFSWLNVLTEDNETPFYAAVHEHSITCLQHIRSALTDTTTGEVSDFWKNMCATYSDAVTHHETPFHALCQQDNAADIIPHLLDTPYDDTIVNTQDEDGLTPQFKLLEKNNIQAMIAIYQNSRAWPQDTDITTCVRRDAPDILQTRITCAGVPKYVHSFETGPGAETITQCKNAIRHNASQTTRSIVALLEALQKKYILSHAPDIEQHLEHVDLMPFIVEGARVLQQMNNAWQQDRSTQTTMLNNAAKVNVEFLLDKLIAKDTETPCLTTLRNLKDTITPRQAIYQHVYWAWNVLRGLHSYVPRNYRIELEKRQIHPLTSTFHS